jgi:hypothetical protein
MLRPTILKTTTLLCETNLLLPFVHHLTKELTTERIDRRRQ